VIIFVDSDVLIEVSRGRNQEILSTWNSLSESGTTILYSPVSAAELWAGARPEENEYTEQLFLSLDCVHIDHSIGELAGKFMRLYGKSHSLKLGDALIAASSQRSKAHLWTRNRKHFPIKDLLLY
jgi:predicted nucleic acid-binding protein